MTCAAHSLQHSPCLATDAAVLTALGAPGAWVPNAPLLYGLARDVRVGKHRRRFDRPILRPASRFRAFDPVRAAYSEDARRVTAIAPVTITTMTAQAVNPTPAASAITDTAGRWSILKK